MCCSALCGVVRVAFLQRDDLLGHELYTGGYIGVAVYRWTNQFCKRFVGFEEYSCRG